jgi:hypothetical protein
VRDPVDRRVLWAISAGIVVGECPPAASGRRRADHAASSAHNDRGNHLTRRPRDGNNETSYELRPVLFVCMRPLRLCLCVCARVWPPRQSTSLFGLAGHPALVRRPGARLTSDPSKGLAAESGGQPDGAAPGQDERRPAATFTARRKPKLIVIIVGTPAGRAGLSTSRDRG